MFIHFPFLHFCHQGKKASVRLGIYWLNVTVLESRTKKLLTRDVSTTTYKKFVSVLDFSDWYLKKKNVHNFRFKLKKDASSCISIVLHKTLNLLYDTIIIFLLNCLREESKHTYILSTVCCCHFSCIYMYTMNNR